MEHLNERRLKVLHRIILALVYTDSHNLGENCNESLIIKLAEALIPDSFKDQYARHKPTLMATVGTTFDAIITFLRERINHILIHDPDKFIDVSMQEPEPWSKSVTEVKASAPKPEVITQKRHGKKGPYTKAVSERKVGRCPICYNFHYFVATYGDSEGHTLTSSYLTSCDVYENATPDVRAHYVLTNDACTICTNWNHDG